MTDTQTGLFVPSSDQIRTKAFFWTRYKANGSDAERTLASAIEITNDARLRSWWNDTFAAWFFNDTAFDEELEALVQEIPYFVRDILESETPQLSTKVNAIKLVGELAGLFRKEDSNASNKAKTREELQKLIKEKGGRLLAMHGGTNGQKKA